MRRRGRVLWILVPALAALGILAAVFRGGRTDAPRDVALEGERKGPALVLLGVDFTETRPGGAVVRLQSDRATYAVVTRNVSAEGVSVALPGASGEIVVRAPLADWSMDAGSVRLPLGGRATGGGGWSATVPDARLDLAAREMTASGATLSGPGLAVEGRNLVWKWRDGTLALEAARGRVVPGKAVRRHG